MEHELSWYDFGDLQQEDAPASQDPKDPMDRKDPKGTKESASLAEDEAEEARTDAARAARFEAVLTQAMARWEMDSEWERAQRARGLEPSDVSHPAHASGSGSRSTLASASAGPRSWVAALVQPRSAHAHARGASTARTSTTLGSGMTSRFDASRVVRVGAGKR